MSAKTIFKIVSTYMASAGVVLAAPTLITFDDITTVTYPITIPSPYNGLNWNSFGLENAPAQTADIGPNGYQNGLVSGNYVAINFGGGPASLSRAGSFNFISAYLTAAWNDNLEVQVQGFSQGSLLYDNTYVLGTASPSLLHFNYLGVDTVDFNIFFDGTPHGYSGAGTFFAVDNLTVDLGPVPEPGAARLLLFAAALCSIGGLMKKTGCFAGVQPPALRKLAAGAGFAPATALSKSAELLVTPSRN